MNVHSVLTVKGEILVSESDSLPGYFFIQNSEGGMTIGLSRAEAIELAAKLAAVAGVA